MTEPIKSVLLVDYDSLHQSLAGAGGEAAARLAAGAPGWLAAIESGQLIGPDSIERTIKVKRCYADSALLGPGSDHFAAAGFEVIDCPAGGAGTRSADLNMAMDAIGTLADPAGYDEFILLSAEPSLAPLLTRLRLNKRRIVIYGDTRTTPGYRALADAVIEVASLAEFLLTRDAAAASTAAQHDRVAIEAFARKIHAATNIPLFSPKTFAELFRFLAEEIAVNGYHFQTTAKNVADRLVETGRSVTRRQVVFIVKGLALKGHVFSTTDTPRRLAEVFREQAHYLIDNARLTLDEREERLLSAWLVGRVAQVPVPPAARAEPAQPPPMKVEPAAAPPQATATPVEAEKPAATPAKLPAGQEAAASPVARLYAEEKAVSHPTKPAAGEKPTAPAAQPAAQEMAAATSAKPAAEEKPPAETRASRQEALAEAKPGKTMMSPDAAKAAIAARVAASVRIRPESPLATPTKPVPESKPAAREAEAPRTPSEPASIESSILAAIAEAVDVLVEDSGKAKPAPQPPAKKKQQPQRVPPEPKPKPMARPEAEPGGQGDDIGNEIQRIIATYNRSRKEAPRK